MTYARIIGTGSALPEKVVSNFDLEKIIDTSHDWIVERTGIERRHICDSDETISMLATKAARNAIEMAGIDPEDIDLIIVGTATPELAFPSTACMVQRELGIQNCIAFDINAACSGFVYGLGIAKQWIESGTAKHVLLIGADTLSRVVDWNDRATCVLFGDGAGAAILSADEETGVLSTHMHSDGVGTNLLYATSSLSETDNPPKIRMRGNEVYKFAVRSLSDLVAEELKENNITQADIDWFVPHQANLRIIKAAADRIGLPMDRVILTIQDHGNTSAASIPMALDVAVRDGRIKKGHRLLFDAFGAGFAWASSYLVF